MERNRTEGGRHECANKCAGSFYHSNQKAAAQDKDSTKAKLALSCKLEIMDQVDFLYLFMPTIYYFLILVCSESILHSPELQVIKPALNLF